MTGVGTFLLHAQHATRITAYTTANSLSADRAPGRGPGRRDTGI
ncbi:hypothetical protein [Streptomyces sp. NPDC054784]